MTYCSGERDVYECCRAVIKSPCLRPVRAHPSGEDKLGGELHQRFAESCRVATELPAWNDSAPPSPALAALRNLGHFTWCRCRNNLPHQAWEIKTCALHNICILESMCALCSAFWVRLCYLGITTCFLLPPPGRDLKSAPSKLITTPSFWSRSPVNDDDHKL